MLRRILFVTSVLGLVLAACGGDDAAGPSGFQSYSGDGFSIEVPADWQVVSPDDLDVEGILDDGMADLGLNPADAADAVSAQFAAGARVFAFDFEESAEGFVDNLNVLEAPAPPFGARELLELNLDQMEQAGFVISESEVRSYPAGDGFFMRFDFGPGAAAAGALSATIITPDAQWVLTFTATDPDRARAEFDRITESFQVG